MLTPGDVAPDFTLISDEGRQVRLRDFRGQSVVLYFYPKDNTPGCTREACAFRDNEERLEKAHAVVVGMSLDGIQSHQRFKAKFHLPFTLLCDEDGVVSKAYGVYKKKSLYGRSFWGIERTTFILGPDGRIQAVFPKVQVNGHSENVLKALTA